MAKEPESEVPEGAAVFPLIPEELGVHPLLLATLHAVVFLQGTDEELLNADAGDEALGFMTEYLQRLNGPELQRLREDLATLNDFARQEKWPKAQIEFLHELLGELGIDKKKKKDGK